MRVQGDPNPSANGLFYMLGDHLGSTSLVTDAAGNEVSEKRYTPWGETRYSSGAAPSSRGFTGQQEEAGIGLYFFNARWYDPSLGRFTQADTVVPGGVQGLDRYAYGYNAPVLFTDPSGHSSCAGAAGDLSGGCISGEFTVSYSMALRDDYWTSSFFPTDEMFEKYGVTLVGGFSDYQRKAIWIALVMIGYAVKQEGETTAEAFKRVMGPVKFVWCGTGRTDDVSELCTYYEDPEKAGYGTCTDGDGNAAPCSTGGLTGYGNGKYVIYFWTMSGDGEEMGRTINNVIHELGHVLYGRAGDPALPFDAALIRSKALVPNKNGKLDTQQHPGSNSESEVFADMFIAFVLGEWQDTTAGATAEGWMNSWIPIFDWTNPTASIIGQIGWYIRCMITNCLDGIEK
jgi:RHS repeat-associated protein